MIPASVFRPQYEGAGEVFIVVRSESTEEYPEKGKPAKQVAPSSRGLGRRALNAVTGVRIPLGLPIKDQVDCTKSLKKSLTQEDLAGKVRKSPGNTGQNLVD
jgi:hypothetical protein